MTAPHAPATGRTIPIADQIDELAREIRNRERYPSPRITPEVALRKLTNLRAAHATLRTVAAHADGLRTLIAYLRRAAEVAGRAGCGSCESHASGMTSEGATKDDQPGEVETEILLAHPAVRAVLDTWPDAVVTEIAPSEPIAYTKEPAAA